jgi:hypothetical protein
MGKIAESRAQRAERREQSAESREHSAERREQNQSTVIGRAQRGKQRGLEKRGEEVMHEA